MKTTILALFATLAGFATIPARADSRVHVGININAPAIHRPEFGGPRFAAPHGYWREVVAKTWVPGSWVITHNRWGRPVRTYSPAHFAYTTNRVWVDHRSGNFRDNHYRN